MKNIVIIFFALFLISCGNKGDNLNSLSESELSLKIDEYYSQKNIPKTIEAINLFVEKYPSNPKAPEQLKNLALIYTNDLKDINSAISQYKKIISLFPKSAETPNAYFTLGFIYNNELKDYSNAKYYYEEFIKLFPEHEAVQSAKFELANLGKSSDEIILNLQNK